MTTEEYNTPVKFADLQIMLEEIAKTIINGEETTYVAWLGAIERVTDAIIKRIELIEYENIRNVYFFMNLISSLNSAPLNSLQEYYKKYCDEFDRLNKKE